MMLTRILALFPGGGNTYAPAKTQNTGVILQKNTRKKGRDLLERSRPEW